MTNEEAIKKMQAVKAYMISGNPIWSVTEMGEAFDMAIEALKQPQIIRCKDCKHRDANRCVPPHMDCEQLDGTDEWWLEVKDDDYCSRAERREEK